MIDYNKINESISSNNTKKIKYVIYFYIYSSFITEFI